jgi:hypothetical protein
MMQPLFLFGAGFNADASKEAGSGEKYRNKVAYPLAADIVSSCADLVSSSDGESPEQMFARALKHSPVPLENLAERLYNADHCVALELASGERPNCYQKFFDTFTGSHFLTFNYDSLPETFLFKRKKWYPHDGYGVPVEAGLSWWQADLPRQKSTAHVIHLHGSLCIRTSELQVEGNPFCGTARLSPCERPLYQFDSYSIAGNFQGYDRPVGRTLVEDSVIAPIPNKTDELKRPFIEDSYDRALALVCAAKNVVAIGYSFNQYDQVSYRRILRFLAETRGRLVLVSPEAPRVATSLRREYPSLEIEPIETGFASWVAASFPGVN